MPSKPKFLVFHDHGEIAPHVEECVFVFTIAMEHDNRVYTSTRLKDGTHPPDKLCLDDHEERAIAGGFEGHYLTHPQIIIPDYHGPQNYNANKFTYACTGFMNVEDACAAFPNADCIVAENVNELTKLYSDFIMERKREMVAGYRAHPAAPQLQM